MTCLEQLERWAAGENVHNHERDECCPDFACCQPNNHFPPALRKDVLQAYRTGGADAVFPYLGMALASVCADSGVMVHIAGEESGTA